MVTRRSLSGRLHGPEQQISLDDAFKAHTINAARQLKRDHDLGSLEVGKLADFVELSADPFTVDSDKLTDQVKVLGTWVDGVRVDPDAFITHVQAIDPTEHKDLPQAAVTSKCCGRRPRAAHSLLTVRNRARLSSIPVRWNSLRSWNGRSDSLVDDVVLDDSSHPVGLLE